MGKKILITGGAGFLGTHVCELLLKSQYELRVLDLMPDKADSVPNLIQSSSIEYIHGDLRSREIVDVALENIDAVIHLASTEGATASMFRISDSVETNCFGTAVLLEAIIKKNISKLIVGSSMSVYGEGMYMDRNGKPVFNAERKLSHLKNDIWEPLDELGDELAPVSTPEFKPANPQSIYGTSIYTREKICQLAGTCYNYPVTTLRFANIYGIGQPLFSQSHGVVSSIASRFINNKEPIIYEDGYQLRDFIDVKDAANSCKLALEAETKGNTTLNIASGRGTTVKEVTLKLGMILGKNRIYPEIKRQYRAGDIRHCFADISQAREKIGYVPLVGLDEGLYEFGEWVKDQDVQDRINEASIDWTARGLTI